MAALAAFVTGLFAWTFVEYAIHAWLGHTFRTFVMPFHEGHHRDPRRVFAIRVWPLLALDWTASAVLYGFSTGVIFYTGLLTGFVFYEWLHYRIHFALPRTKWETRLRTRHLIHHSQAAARGFGVTSGLWDLVFGTELSRSEDWRYAELAARTPPLAGPSNIRALWPFNLRRTTEIG
jgi:sterol desaturase/sphingolipid hydroxylase (fatty acid hydroxylase superfamily)